MTTTWANPIPFPKNPETTCPQGRLRRLAKRIRFLLQTPYKL